MVDVETIEIEDLMKPIHFFQSGNKCYVEMKTGAIVEITANQADDILDKLHLEQQLSLIKSK